ncbi:MAG TPA: hypothetical protein DCX06_12630 [Opitutae bacterium]|nr:hypothetical protein [Opitutae bacterium]
MRLTRSAAASSVLHKFHRTKYIIYVEGDRDFVFWSQLGHLFGIKPKKSGGKSKCKIYAEQLLESNGNYLVCMDRDYDIFANNRLSDARIIYTYGYSIENHVATCSSIAKYLTFRGKGDIIDIHTIKKIANQWHSYIRELILLDIYFHVKSTGLPGPFSGSGLDLFDSNGLSDVKIQQAISRFKKKIDAYAFDEWKVKIPATKHDLKGKFTFLLVKEMVLKVFNQKKSHEDDMFAFMMQSLLTDDYKPKSLKHLIIKTELAVKYLGSLATAA